MTGTVHVELPEAWRPLAVSPDGARRRQRALVDEVLTAGGLPPRARQAARDDVVRRLVRLSRQAARAGAAFAAVLVEHDAAGAVLAGGLTMSLAALGRAEDGDTALDPGTAAGGLLQVLGAAGGPLRRTELISLRPNPEVLAVLLRERTAALQNATAVPMSLAQVHWLVPGTRWLATVSVTTPNRELAAAFEAVAVSVAASLRLDLEHNLPAATRAASR